ncbi:MAG: nuclear receptor-binding factor 2 [Bacteroidales bacterium]|nr:nuclear receptor-binding factor 2 [Bacteroidales bacterium]
MLNFNKYFWLSLLLIFEACSFEKNQFNSQIGIVKLKNINDSLNIIQHIVNDSIISEWELKYPIYNFDYGDLNSDGENEIVVGVVKKTRYWKKGNRLFIYKLYNGKLIRPLWLGSRLGGEILDFKVERDSIPARIFTIEDYNDSIVNVMYSLGGFGLNYQKIINVKYK